MIFELVSPLLKMFFPLNKFFGGGALGYEGSRFYNGVGGSCSFGGTGACPWAEMTCRSVTIWPSSRKTLVSREVTSCADHEAVNLIVEW